MPDILHQDKHVQSATATYCGTPIRIVSYFVDDGRQWVRIEFADKTQLTVSRDQISIRG